MGMLDLQKSTFRVDGQSDPFDQSAVPAVLELDDPARSRSKRNRPGWPTPSRWSATPSPRGEREVAVVGVAVAVDRYSDPSRAEASSTSAWTSGWNADMSVAKFGV
jgi:hypothetical protein